MRVSARLEATWRDFEAFLPACPPCTAVYSKEKVAASYTYKNGKNKKHNGK